MKTQVVVIHGGDTFDSYEEYFSALNQMHININDFRVRKWKKTLQEKLGESFDVLLPDMPNALNAKYAEWKIWFEKIIPQLDEKVVLAGHSLGAIFLAKYLSENEFPKKILGTLLVAAPYSFTPAADFILQNDLNLFEKQGGEIILYHSKDDPVVSFNDLEKYKKAMPSAQTRVFEDRKHFNQLEFPELVEDIKSLV